MATTIQTPNPAVDAWLAATELRQRLANGADPPVIEGPVALPHKELLHADVPVQALWFGAIEATYPENRLLAFGGITTLAVTATASAIANSRRRARAQALAAPQWRPFGHGQTLVTNRRLLIGDSTWTSVWYPSIRTLRPHFAANCLDVTANGHHPYRLQGPWAAYLTVLLQPLIYQE